MFLSFLTKHDFENSASNFQKRKFLGAIRDSKTNFFFFLQILVVENRLIHAVFLTKTESKFFRNSADKQTGYCVILFNTYKHSV